MLPARIRTSSRDPLSTGYPQRYPQVFHRRGRDGGPRRPADARSLPPVLISGRRRHNLVMAPSCRLRSTRRMCRWARSSNEDGLRPGSAGCDAGERPATGSRGRGRGRAAGGGRRHRRRPAAARVLPPAGDQAREREADCSVRRSLLPGLSGRVRVLAYRGLRDLHCLHWFHYPAVLLGVRCTYCAVLYAVHLGMWPTRHRRAAEVERTRLAGLCGVRVHRRRWTFVPLPGDLA